MQVEPQREKVLAITLALSGRRRALKKLMLSMAMLAAILVGTVPALAQGPVEEPSQVPVAIVDCVLGGPCIGTPGDDTITGSSEQDVIYALEGDDTIDPGNDAVADYVFCGPGFDTVDQMPGPVEQGFLQYDAQADFIADDCEVVAL
jgi:hypothetical protein